MLSSSAFTWCTIHPSAERLARRISDARSLALNLAQQHLGPTSQAAPVASCSRPSASLRGQKCCRSQTLTKPDSDKDVRLVTFDLGGTNLRYRAGDSLGVYPENCPDLVQAILDRLVRAETNSSTLQPASA